MNKRGFTIIELLVVITIISILLTLVFTGISGSMADARARHAEALCQAVQSGLASYYAQKQEWPGNLGGYVESGNFPGNRTDTYTLTASEVREMVKALVDEAKDGNTLMDISGLYVSSDPGESGGKAHGLDFISAVRGTKKSGRRMTTANMYFGYPDKETGRFRRFRMTYSIPTDSVRVTVQ